MSLKNVILRERSQTFKKCIWLILFTVHEIQEQAKLICAVKSSTVLAAEEMGITTRGMCRNSLC